MSHLYVTEIIIIIIFNKLGIISIQSIFCTIALHAFV